MKGDLLPVGSPAAVAALSGFVLVEGSRGAWDDEAHSVRIRWRGQ